MSSLRSMAAPQWQGKPRRWRPSCTHSCTPVARHDRGGALVDADEVDQREQRWRRTASRARPRAARSPADMRPRGRLEGAATVSDMCVSLLGIARPRCGVGDGSGFLALGSTAPAPAFPPEGQWHAWEMSSPITVGATGAGVAPASPHHRFVGAEVCRSPRARAGKRRRTPARPGTGSGPACRAPALQERCRPA